MASPVVLMVKNSPASAGDVRDVNLTLGLGSFLGGGHGNTLQYSYLGNPMDKGAWGATVHRVANSWTWMKWLSMHTTQNWFALSGLDWLSWTWLLRFPSTVAQAVFRVLSFSRKLKFPSWLWLSRNGPKCSNCTKFCVCHNCWKGKTIFYM